MVFPWRTPAKISAYPFQSSAAAAPIAKLPPPQLVIDELHINRICAGSPLINASNPARAIHPQCKNVASPFIPHTNLRVCDQKLSE